MKNKFSKIIKYNSGNGAIICSNCGTILKIGSKFDTIEDQYCSTDVNSKEHIESIKILNKRIKDDYYLCDKCKILKNN